MLAHVHAEGPRLHHVVYDAGKYFLKFPLSGDQQMMEMPALRRARSPLHAVMHLIFLDDDDTIIVIGEHTRRCHARNRTTDDQRNACALTGHAGHINGGASVCFSRPA